MDRRLSLGDQVSFDRALDEYLERRGPSPSVASFLRWQRQQAGANGAAPAPPGNSRANLPGPCQTARWALSLVIFARACCTSKACGRQCTWKAIHLYSIDRTFVGHASQSCNQCMPALESLRHQSLSFGPGERAIVFILSGWMIGSHHAGLLLARSLPREIYAMPGGQGDIWHEVVHTDGLLAS